MLACCAPRYGAAEARIDGLASRLIAAIRAESGGLGGVEDFLHAYSLSTKEGLALMVLAEALLRVPDAATADQLIEDKLAAGDWWHRGPRRQFPGLGLGLDAGHHGAHHSAGRDARQHPRKPGEAAWPARSARRDAPGHAAPRLAFCARADDRGGPQAGRRRARVPLLLRHARRRRAHRRGRGELFRILCRRDRRHGRRAGEKPLPDRPGISVKLSALHPRFEAVSRDRILRELVPRALELARRA